MGSGPVVVEWVHGKAEEDHWPTQTHVCPPGLLLLIFGQVWNLEDRQTFSVKERTPRGRMRSVKPEDITKRQPAASRVSFEPPPQITQPKASTPQKSGQTLAWKKTPSRQ